MERALIGLRIPFWLKIAVVFATALCIRAEGVQPCCFAVGLKAEGIQPGCVAIGIRSEEAKPLSSDYVCSLSSYCCRDGSFEDSGYGLAACSQPNYVQDDEQGRYKGVSTPIRRCHVRPFGVARCETSIESTKQCFSGGGSHVAVVCRCSNGPARNDIWSTYPIPTMGWCDKSIFGCEHSLGAKPMDKPAASSLRTENVGVCLFGYEICRPCSGQLWPCGMLAVAESSLCVGVFGIHKPRFCGGRCTGQAKHIAGRLLWLQQYVREGVLVVWPVPAFNPGDVGAKVLSRQRLLALSFMRDFVEMLNGWMMSLVVLLAWALGVAAHVTSSTSGNSLGEMV